ncbi:sugar ABC transporter permease [Cohnella cholangitidis]|uniref:Sugar ABC transporter permease n=2 Tax=Cohnella cholangitidis TaxID=2598458 RepID=A0A7G5C6X1_9BACL|nr:sugar ABC transporter permease [Cohnella cholangitidis]
MGLEQASAATLSPQPSLKSKPAKLKQGHFRRFGAFYIMMAPTIVFLLINNYLPMLGSLIAFKDIKYGPGETFFESFLNSAWVGLDNFKFLFQTSDSWTITRNTVVYNAIFIFLNTVIGIAFAIMFNSMRSKKLAKLHQTMMFLPFFLSMVIVSYLVYAFLNNDVGLMNKVIFPIFGIEPIEWYSDPKWWPVILPLVNTWKGIGYYAIIFMAAIIGIDDEYYEAATIDGATKWKQIVSITLPLIKPVIIVMVMLQVGRIFAADFGLFWQVTRNSGAIYETTRVIDTYVYQGFINAGDIGMSSAAGLYQSVVGFVIVFGANLIIRRISKDDALF